MIVSDKIKGDSIRLAVVSDLHSCAYGDSQLMLSGEISAAEPDAVLFAGDIFDDRLPDDKAQALIMEVAKRHPCFYVSGNHEPLRRTRRLFTRPALLPEVVDCGSKRT